AGIGGELSQCRGNAVGDIGAAVTFHGFEARLLQPLSNDRAAAISSLESMERDGGTDIADGITAALTELAANARPGSSRAIMLFTDGRSNERKALKAMEQARARGIAVHTLQLGTDEGGTEVLKDIAAATGGSALQVTDPAELPQAFLDLRTTGVDAVAVSVNGGELIPASLAGGDFSAPITLKAGENQIVAIATGLDGSTASTEILVNSGPPNCAALEVQAFRNGLPTAFLDERSIEIVVDASRSMWGRMEGEPKMTVAKQTLLSVSEQFPGHSHLALRAYGNNSASEQKDCNDSELLVEFGRNNHADLASAIEGLSPRGQTPLAYALSEAGNDFRDIDGDKAVVLVTDGIESCGGDPVAEASRLRDEGVAIHVIGFGIGSADDEDSASLDAIAQAADGRFFMAGSAEELKDALAGSVGTPFKIYDGIRLVGSSVLGSDEPILLPEGQYLVELETSPPQELAVTLVPGEKLTVTLEKQDWELSERQQRQTVGYTPCPTDTQEAVFAGR
ncbi:MAG: VWA domain-containing protein, partial [Halieaceae bacterium]|nr:VWA domain-containing protein [Halieaceae bacterium]